LPFRYLFVAGGGLLFLGTARDWVRGGRATHAVPLVLAAALFATWVAGTVWGLETPLAYHHPLALEGLARNRFSQDTVYHAAIANMLKTHGVPSTGLDGLPYFRYHYGSHWVVAQLSRLLGQPVLDFYQLGFPVVLVPFLLHCLLQCVLAVRGLLPAAATARDLRSDGWFWVVMLCGFVGFAPTALLQRAGVDTPCPFLSVSHNLGLSVALLVLGLLAAVCPPLRNRPGPLSRAEACFFVVAVPALLAVVGLCKISLAFLLLGLLAYLFWRGRAYRRPVLWVGLAAAFAASYATFRAVREPAGLAEVRFLGYLRDTVAPDWRPFHLLLLWAWPLLYAALRVRAGGLRTLADLRSALAARQLLDVEALAVLALLGLAPGLILYLHSNEEYFTDFQRWAGLALVLGCLPLFVGRPGCALPGGRRTLRAAPAAVLLLLLLHTLFFRWYDRLGGLVLTSLAIRGAAPDLVAAVKQATAAGEVRKAWRLCREAVRGPRAADGPARDTPAYRLLQALHDLEQLPAAEKRRTALFIPRTTRAYWDLVSDAGNASLGPALSGLAMIDGLPPLGQPVHWYGYNFYPRAGRQREDFGPGPTGERILRRAHSLGFTKVLVLETDRGGCPRTYYLGPGPLATQGAPPP
jgi:hypothetical protein